MTRTDARASRFAVSQCRDPALLSALHARCFETRWSIDAFADMLEAATVFAALNETTESLGYIVLRTAADEAEIISLGVVPAARRSGVATALLKCGVRHVGAGGATSLFLEVAEDNIAARAFYESRQFARIGRRDAYYSRLGAVAVDAIVMRRAIGV